jgi:hypothetical protein
MGQTTPPINAVKSDENVASSAVVFDKVSFAFDEHVGAFPGGAMFFTSSRNGNEPDFGNYALGASFTLNVNGWVGIEGEGGGTIGLHQNFSVGSTAFTNQRTPSMWAYRAISLSTRREATARSCRMRSAGSAA